MKTFKTSLLLHSFLLFLINAATAQSWSLTGNAGTNASLNFIGTTDSVPVTIKANNKVAGYLDCDYLKANTSFGYKALSLNTGHDNVAIGYQTLFQNTTGGINTAIGNYSLYSNTTGLENTASGFYSMFYNTTGGGNTASGFNSLYINKTGDANTTSGTQSMASNVSGSWNVAAGGYALTQNITGNSNTAIGSIAMQYNKTGYSNVAVGVQALTKNVSGHNLVAVGDSALFNLNEDSAGASANTAVGSKSQYLNSTGLQNTAVGFQTLFANTSGDGNTAVGTYALNKNKTGNNNTALGYYAGPSATKGAFNNTTALGFNAIPTASNQVRVGNANVTSIGGYVGWTDLPSDVRFKKNIKDNVPGLAFINQLRTVTYNVDVKKLKSFLDEKDEDQTSAESIAEKEKIIRTGFIAQQVEEAAKKIGYDFSGVDKPKSEKDLYGLRYAEFVVPLVKAVQELSTMNNDKDAKIAAQDKKIEEQDKKINALIAMMQQLQQNFNSCNACAQQSAMSNELPVISGAALQQNIPNPFNNTTTINYTLPGKYSSAKIIVVDKTGKVLRQMNLSQRNGSVQVDASTLAGGAYHYSLYVDGKLIETKQMEHIK